MINVSISGRDRLWFRFASNPTEKIFGGGEQFTYMNLKGREFPMWTREQGVIPSLIFLSLYNFKNFSFTTFILTLVVFRLISLSLFIVYIL